ncbi:glucuronoxylanase XynC precursor [mine drainage metagenome]|uniref:Glucuronoxylanase XynC n=1 Tax=mine drainage metagenome TaxID=410659 RepID=A0A1J5SIK3_9ZZZZ
MLALVLGALAASARGATALVDVANEHQVIRGFGGATAFMPTQPLAASDLDALFGNGPGQIGLTLLRIRVASDDAWRAVELANALGAEQRGAQVIGTPWSPPASMKTNGSLIGGSLKTTSYADYATYLNDFARMMAAAGAPLYAISVQNEPDISVTYESCDWTAAQMLDFCRNNAGAITATRVIAPESFQFNHALSDPILNDPMAAAHVDIIGGHIYGGGLADYPLARQMGKEVWMTEHLDLSTDWPGALATGREISDCLAVANFNAYFWWYLKRYYGPLGEDGVVTKRGYVMAQFAKFIRPGYVRVDATENPATGVHVSAYAGGRLVIVAVNQQASSVQQDFSVVDGTVNSLTPWTTSASLSLAEQPAIAVVNGGFSATLPAQSVTTFVGDLVVTPPTIVSAPQGHRMALGSTVVLDVEASGEYLSYQWSRDGVPIPGATDRMLTLRNLHAAEVGGYTVAVTNPGGTVVSPPATLSVVTTSNPGRLVALSGRSPVGTGDNVQIAGVAISGTAQKALLVRAAGPALNSVFGITGVLADPMIDLYDQSSLSVIASADNWDASLAGTFKALGAFAWPAGSKDAAMLESLKPGLYTALVRGADGGTGNALVELYDADGPGAQTQLVALSVRSVVGTGDAVQIGGFVIGGTTARTVVIRSSGPSLGALFGVSGVLPDPELELHDQSDARVIATAEGWDDLLASHFYAVGAFPWPDGSSDSALVRTLDPGVYTVIVRGAAGDTGVALLEIYAEK